VDPLLGEWTATHRRVSDVGPRIIGYSFIGDENVLGWHRGARVETALGEFKPYGGHRLWIAPENMPNSYAPVKYFFDKQNNSIRLIQPVESITKTQKKIAVSPDKKGSGVPINHRITNRSVLEIELESV